MSLHSQMKERKNEEVEFFRIACNKIESYNNQLLLENDKLKEEVSSLSVRYKKAVNEKKIIEKNIKSLQEKTSRLTEENESLREEKTAKENEKAMQKKSVSSKIIIFFIVIIIILSVALLSALSTTRALKKDNAEAFAVAGRDMVLSNETGIVTIRKNDTVKVLKSGFVETIIQFNNVKFLMNTNEFDEKFKIE